MSLDDFPRTSLLFGPSPIHPLPRLGEAVGGKVEIWAKREDSNSGIDFGGNKVRKLGYLVADALAQNCDTLVSIGGIQSNHTRQVTGVARHLGLGAVTVQEAEHDVFFDHVIVCTVTGSTHTGMIAGFALEDRDDRRVVGDGIPDESTIEAIHLAARTEGMLTDPVYKGKSMAGLIDRVRTGEIPAGSRVLYAHLGGQPALSAYSGAPGLG